MVTKAPALTSPGGLYSSTATTAWAPLPRTPPVQSKSGQNSRIKRPSQSGLLSRCNTTPPSSGISRHRNTHLSGSSKHNKLLSITQQPDESLTTVASRVSDALARVQELRPDLFTINKLDEELAVMAMLRALPRDVYGEFVSSLMCQKDLSRADVEAAFQVKQVKRNVQNGPLMGSAALRTFGRPTTSKADAGDLNKGCKFCTLDGHVQDSCYNYKAAREECIKAILERKANKGSRPRANRAKAVEQEEVVEQVKRAQTQGPRLI